jgi:parvulin-like peptidyl-prolyl isomerase
VSETKGGATTEPEHIEVQHILIGFSGSVPGKRITRTNEEARALAYDLLAKAQAGEDYDALVRKHTDDSPPGIYGMSNRGAQPGRGEYARDGMVPAFGDVGFTLDVGAYGVADHDPRTSPYGYHVIKRVK